MRDDLNTPEVIAAAFGTAGRAAQEVPGRPMEDAGFASLAEVLGEVLTTLGFDLPTESSTEVGGVRVRYEEDPGEAVLSRVAERDLARQKRDWPRADRLRDELAAEGWSIEDTSEGPFVRRR